MNTEEEIRIPKRKPEFERCETGVPLTGWIENVEFEQAHLFRVKGTERIDPAVRFQFLLHGYQYPHYSRWMTCSSNENANLFKTYLEPLVEGAKPDMDINLKELVGLKVRVKWDQKNGFEFPVEVEPLEGKLRVLELQPDEA